VTGPAAAPQPPEVPQKFPTDPFVRIVLVDRDIDPSARLFAGISMDRSPTFSVSEVAKVFFARTDHWVRWRERVGDLSDTDGTPIGQRTQHGARFYDLADVEAVLHAAAAHGAITGAQLYTGLKIAHAISLSYGILTASDNANLI